ncbi:hypothetical protein ACW23B_13715 [Streptomyces albidoflavus]
MVLLAADGVAIEAVYEPADFDADVTQDAAGRVPVTVVAHGFTGSAAGRTSAGPRPSSAVTAR